MLSKWTLVATGKFGSLAASKMYVEAPATALQVKVMDSIGWNCVPPTGGLSVGVPGDLAFVPVTVKLRVAEKAP
jgi:hypothetical protein